MKRKEFNANKKYLVDTALQVVSQKIWDNKPFSVELESYTNAGGDMIIDLEELSKECLKEYTDNFDVNDEVMGWWREGEAEAHRNGVPFDNIKEHYKDVEDWLEMIKEICENMPY